jgi:hypothetical protein
MMLQQNLHDIPVVSKEGKLVGIGERNSLHGFAPLGLFMQALGVTILSSSRVKLEGRNLFPWPVTIKHKDLTISRGLEQTVVTFSNGESVIVKEETPCIVEMYGVAVISQVTAIDLKRN